MTTYQVIEKIGRAGGFKNRELVKQNWNNKFGEGNWLVGYVFEGKTYTREEALQHFYNESYLEFIKNNLNKINHELIKVANELYNPHALFTTGVDLQTPAVLYALEQLNINLQGNKKIAIGTFQPKQWNSRNLEIAKDYDMNIINNKISYPYISTFLSPYKVPLLQNKNISVEDFWQDYKYLLTIVKA